MKRYLGSASDGSTPPGVANGAWTAGSSSHYRRVMNRRSIFAGATVTEAFTAGQTKAVRLWVFDEPLSGMPLGGVTVKCYMAGNESNADDNVRPRLELFVLSPDLMTVRGTALAIANYGSGNELGTSVRGIAFADGDAMSAVTPTPGDKLVIILGGADTSGTTPSISIYTGGTESDVAEDESTTGNHAGWIEFSNDNIFIPVPTFVGPAVNPVDTGALSGATPALNIAAALTAAEGDLVFLIAEHRAAGASISIAEPGGQSWQTVATAPSNTSITMQAFWCRFDGTWDAPPSVNSPDGLIATTLSAGVFRPTLGSLSTWAVDVDLVELDFAAGSSPFTKTIAGITTTKRNAVIVAAWAAPDDNTWDASVGPGWTSYASPPSGLQYRNGAGSDQSMCVMYKVQALAGATGDVSLNQATLGGDAGTTLIMAFYEQPTPVLMYGSIAPAGALAKQTSKSYAGATTPTGALLKTCAKLLAGAITPEGATAKLIARTFAGAIAPAGAVLKLVAIALVGSVLVTGALVKTTAKLLGGVVEPIGTIAKQIGKTLAGVVAPIGSLVKLVAKLFGGGVTPAGALEHSEFSTNFVAVTATVEERNRVRMTEIREDNAGTLAIEERERVMLADEEED